MSFTTTQPIAILKCLSETDLENGRVVIAIQKCAPLSILVSLRGVTIFPCYFDRGFKRLRSASAPESRLSAIASRHGEKLAKNLIFSAKTGLAAFGP